MHLNLFLSFILISIVQGSEVIQISHTDCGEMDPITSPNFSPDDATAQYPLDQHITWVVTGAPSQTFAIQFTFLELEEGPTVDACYDYVDVYDGNVLTTAPYHFGRLCGLDSLLHLITLKHQFSIVFHSDEEGAAAGFKIQYTPMCSGCNLNGCDRDTASRCMQGKSCPGFLSFSINTWRCPSVEQYCAVPCSTCPESTIPMCTDIAETQDPSLCHVEHYSPCSQTQGVGIMVMLYWCPSTADIPFPINCQEPCCCEPNVGVGGPAPPINCRSPGVRLIYKDRHLFCTEN